MPVSRLQHLQWVARSIPIFTAYLFLYSSLRSCLALDNGLARLPFQGWNSWNVCLLFLLCARALERLV